MPGSVGSLWWLYGAQSVGNQERKQRPFSQLMSHGDGLFQCVCVGAVRNGHILNML